MLRKSSLETEEVLGWVSIFDGICSGIQECPRSHQVPLRVAEAVSELGCPPRGPVGADPAGGPFSYSQRHSGFESFGPHPAHPLESHDLCMQQTMAEEDREPSFLAACGSQFQHGVGMRGCTELSRGWCFFFFSPKAGQNLSQKG